VALPIKFLPILHSENVCNIKDWEWLGEEASCISLWTDLLIISLLEGI
jgi:hypothetical protein